MTDFKVTPDALDRAAADCESAAEANRATASGMTPPPGLMLGIFMGPFVNILDNVLHSGARYLVNEVGTENTALGSTLRATAANYRTAEDFATKCAKKVGKVGQEV